MANNVEINIPNISKELNQTNASASEKKAQKACLFTLIIYAQNSRVASHLQDQVEAIIEKFPCRIIFIHENAETEKSFLNVKVENISSGNIKSGVLISCDQITVEASTDQLFRVPFLVMPYIVTDLPLYLLWGQNPFKEQDIFPHLKPYATRVIFDSECSSELQLFCNEMLEDIRAIHSNLMDINWAFVSNWRDVLFQVFDTPEKCAHLQDCKSLTITYNDKKGSTYLHPEIRAIYLQGWLAARMGWNYRQTEKFYENMVISYYGKVTPVVIALTPQSREDLPSGAIISIEIVMTNGDTVLLERKARIGQVAVHISSKIKCELPFTLELPNVHRGMSFMKEIFFNEIGDQYYEMLKMICNIKIVNGTTS